MALSDVKVRNAKPAARPYKLFDGGSMFLAVNPSGSKCWRMKYIFLGKERLISFGQYPLVEPVRGDLLSAELVGIIQEYVIMPESAALAIALWIIHTYVFDVFINTPILAVTSPEKQCGKTTLLDVLSCLVQRPQIAANITSAALFRLIDIAFPTLLIDEGDTFIRNNSELRGILNSGHRKGGAVIRTVGDEHEPRAFNTHCPKAIASIKKLPDTIQDRAISILLKRRRSDERISRFSANDPKELNTLSQKCARWANDHRDALSRANPDIPDFLSNRSADNWRALFAIADELDNDNSGTRARNAARELTQANNEEASSISTDLLSDIRLVFEARYIDRLPSKKLVAELTALEDRPWAEWTGGKALSTHQLASLLRAFAITSSSIRIEGGRTPKGYKRDQFIDAWGRYLPPLCGDKSATVVARGVSDNAENTNENATCGDVAPLCDGCSPEDDEIPF